MPEAVRSKIQPFEWLTSPESIGGFIQEYVIGDSSENNDIDNDQKDSIDLPFSNLRALHIGCGSSTVGEYLIRKLGFSKVVNVDKDVESMEGMAERWSELKTYSDEKKDAAARQHSGNDKRQEEGTLVPPSTVLHANDDLDSSSLLERIQRYDRMEFWCMDYTSESLPEDYSDSFDLVVDKSTLDCTLCSDCSATASFLTEIYRTLRMDGGVYLVISFHELDLILPLLRDLPGAQWTVTHTTMERQVECLVYNASGRFVACPTDTSFSDAESTEEQNPRKPLNVLIARRYALKENSVDGFCEPSTNLSLESVVQHVQDVNDRWFQDEQPLLTDSRIEDLRKAFSTEKSDQCEEKSKYLSLENAYEVIFTQAEREHLTYDHFLEDWEAFCEDRGQGVLSGGNGNHVNFDLALNFLKANQ